MFEAYDRRTSREAGAAVGATASFGERKPLKICFVVDGRSPIARNWITHFVRPQHEAHVISTYPCAAELLAGATVDEALIAFSGLSGASQDRESSGRTEASYSVLDSFRTSAFAKLSLAAQHWFLPLDLQRNVQKVRSLIDRIAPDIVHAMRIPFEGILAAKATPPKLPLLISVWGNDFTLWASRNPLIARQTWRALQRADGLHCDCQRDLELASREWGFDSKKPAAVLPGAGGVQGTLFHPGEANQTLLREMNISASAPVVFNPRGFRSYVRNDVYFQSIPLVLKDYPRAAFVCAGLRANPIAESWVSRLDIKANVRLLPPAPRARMAELFRLATVAVSPSLHDGTPNTLLEAMACGCFPVSGDIESVREWITDGVNGLLCDPTSPESVARTIIRALSDEQMRNIAREQNLRLIAERAEYGNVMQQAEEFYSKIVRSKQQAFQL
jgi:glycosyltransferase involved in cell wall biosynthesis